MSTIDTRPPDDLEILSQRSFFIPGQPVGKSSVKVQFRAKGKNGEPGKPLKKSRTYYPAKTKNYMRLIAKCYKAACGRLPRIEGSYRVSLFAFYARPKAHFGTGRNAGKIKDGFKLELPNVTPDLINIWKGLEDPLSGIAYTDDRFRVSGLDDKRYANNTQNIGVFCVIEEVRLKEE